MKTELKTLKDLIDEMHKEEDKDNVQHIAWTQMFLNNDLKAEAIKRAKYYTYKANQKGIEDNDIRYWTARRVEVMEFNNLTEEDLK